MLKTGTLNAKENSHIGVDYKGLDKILCSGLSEEEFMKAEEKTLKSVHGGEDISSRLKFAKDLFAAIDKDGNKTLAESEIRNVKSKKSAKVIFVNIDKDGNKTIAESEICNVKSKKLAKDLFDAIDKDGNKTLPESDIRNVKSNELSMEDKVAAKVVLTVRSFSKTAWSLSAVRRTV